MQTDKVKVDGWGIGRDEALELADRFSEYEGLDSRTSMRIRLLAEETLGMVTAIAEDFDAVFWLESTKDGNAIIHLDAETDMDFRKKDAFIAASRDKKNEAATGIMGKIREIIENGMYSMDEAGSLQAEYGGNVLMYSSMGMCDVSASPAVDYMWSLERYRESVEVNKDTDPASGYAWDELEKSIVGNIADDVRVSVKGSRIEMAIEKKIK